MQEKLPMDKQSRMERAKALGFTVVAYHGTDQKFNEFDMEKGKGGHSGFAPYFADKKAEAKGYAEKTEKGRVLQVLLRIKKPFVVPSTWGVMPEDYPPFDPEVYKIVTGGKLPTDAKRERYLSAHDSIEHAMDIHYENTGDYDRKDIWTGIYQRLKKEGYDSILWKDTPADHSEHRYTKIQMLDMSGIRLMTAAFNPANANSTDLRA